MFNSAILDVAIGMTFLYVLLSLLCSGLKEYIAQLANLRASNLKASLSKLLTSQYATKLYNNALINKSGKKENDPEYIPPRDFVLAFLTLESKENTLPTSNQDLLAALKTSDLGKTEAGESVALLIQDAEANLDKAKSNIENWFNSEMTKVSAAYQKIASLIIFGIAFVVCVAFNLDTIQISEKLLDNATLRNLLVQAAANPNQEVLDMLNESVQQKDPLKPSNIFQQVEQLNLPIGWKQDGEWVCKGMTKIEWFVKFIGIMLTTFAASLGAPFWFNLMQKLLNFRSALKPEKPQQS